MAPITLVTGFLGSGKTTLLQALLRQGAGGRRLAVIVNEFGQVGLDGAALARTGAAPVIELPGGCLCCAAGSDFLVAVEEVLAYQPDQIVVETSGLAEPGALVRRAREAGLSLDAIVAVADAANLDAALAAAPVAEWQLRAADIIVLSKGDLISPAAQQAAQSQVRALNPRAVIVPAVQGQLAPELLFGPRQLGLDVTNLPPHQPGDGFTSLVWQSDLPLRRTALVTALDQLPATVYRAKGLVHCSDAPWPDEVHLVAGRHSLTAFRPKQPISPLNTLVLIGPDLAALAATIRTNFDGSADSPERTIAWRARYADLFDA
ncbi:MAG: CobW family GTP-binding protein [Oscillochloridaceae bacterium umkhey_bin13]